MKSCFYAGFVPGMQKVVAEVIGERLSDVSIVKLLDGAVVFETEVSYDKLNFFCFNNIFAVIDIEESDGEFPERHLMKICAMEKNRPAGDVLSEKSMSVISGNNKKIKTFRLVFSVENKPAPVNERLKQEAEKFIARNSTLKLNRTNPDTEFWFLARREGFSCFMKRLTNHGPKENSPRAGELSPQLAWLLCRIARLKHGETAADPFCGYGSIPNAACKHFPIDKFYASDIDPACVKISCSGHGQRQNKRCEFYTADFRSILKQIPGGTVNAVVSDPPWGIYQETTLPLQTIYNEMICVFSKILKDGGRAVILTAAVNELEFTVNSTPFFQTLSVTPILVSGKKASVFVLAKN